MQVVMGHQHGAQNFPAPVEMMQVRAGKGGAGVTVTGRVQRALIIAMTGVADLYNTP